MMLLMMLINNGDDDDDDGGDNDEKPNGDISPVERGLEIEGNRVNIEERDFLQGGQVFLKKERSGLSEIMTIVMTMS